MHDNNWVLLMPRNPDHDIIAGQFFKPAKKGAIVFKAGKCIINLHVLNEIYELMLTRKEEEEQKEEDNVGDTTVDFTVSSNTKQGISN